MTGFEGTVSNARARVASLRFWADHVVPNYDTYAATHAACRGFLSVRAEVVAARDDVRTFATTLDRRLDDSGWVTEVGDAATPWNRAISHAADAKHAVADARLRAVDSWRRGASPRYRAAIPPQRTALQGAVEVCRAAKQGCLALESSGTAHFEAVDDLAAALVGALPLQIRSAPPLFAPDYGVDGYTAPSFLPEPPTYGPQSPDQPEESVPCAPGTLHFGRTDVQEAMTAPLETARTALTTADSALRAAARDAFGEQRPRRPGPQPDSPVIGIPEQLAGTPWPVPGAPRPPAGGRGPAAQ